MPPEPSGDAMKRRSKAGGKSSRARSRKALTPKLRDASKTASSSAPIQHAEVARLTRELNEALEQQAATSEVLGVISAFSSELQRVFQAMLENATRLCDAKFGMVFALTATRSCSQRKSVRRLHLPNTASGAARLNQSKAVTSIALCERSR